MVLKKTSCLILIIFRTCILFGQTDVYVNPVNFSQYYNCYELVNPSLAGSDDYSKMSMGNKKLLGNFSKISTYYFTGYTRLEKNIPRKNSPYSVLGMYVYNDREGKYINRLRFYLTYAWNAHINNNLKIAGGFHLGGMNYSVKGTDLSGNGSDIVPDGIIGIQIYNQHFHIGAAYNQIFNSKVQPLTEIGTLSPFYTFTGSTYFTLSPKLRLKSDALVKIPSISSKVKTDITIRFELDKRLKFGFGIHQNNVIINLIELSQELNNKRILNIAFTYGYPLPSTNYSTNFIEIGLRYLFKK